MAHLVYQNWIKHREREEKWVEQKEAPDTWHTKSYYSLSSDLDKKSFLLYYQIKACQLNRH